STANNDLSNLLTGTNLAVVMLGADGRLRRFTSHAEKLFNLIPTDIGRRIADIKPSLKIPDIEQMVSEVIQSVSIREREVQDADGNWYLMRVRPYRTIDNRIEGAVIAVFDIDPLKRSLEQVNRARDYAEALVETVRESLIVLDEKLTVRTANQFFYRTFETSPLQTEGKDFLKLF